MIIVVSRAVNRKERKMPVKNYSWAVQGIYKITAEQANEEISKLSEVTPHNIVELAKDENSPLHNEFEWNDTVAGEKYREDQARKMLLAIIVKEEKVNKKLVETRAYISAIKRYTYKPIDVVVKDIDEYEHMLNMAMRELQSFMKKYSSLKELEPIFEVIENIKK